MKLPPLHELTRAAETPFWCLLLGRDEIALVLMQGADTIDRAVRKVEWPYDLQEVTEKVNDMSSDINNRVELAVETRRLFGNVNVVLMGENT